MNENLFFDLACAASQSEGAKIGDKTLSSKQVNVAFKKAIQAFMHGVVQKEDNDRKIQAFGSSSDLAVVAKDVFNVTTEVTNYDLLWDEAFRSINLNRGQLSWEIHTAAVGTAFKEIPEGGNITYEGLQSSKETVSVKKYGAGLGITWETMEGRKVYRFIELMEDARSKLYNTWADVHYGLLATAGATNTIAYQGAAADSVLDRDIATINKGYEDISNDNKDSGYGDTANARYLLYTLPTLRSRINRALRATSAEVASLGGNGQVVDANVDPRYSWNSNILANKALMVLPGKKIQNSVYLKNLVLEKTEQESLNKLKTYWTAFGAAIGDNDQVYELSFA
jgi:hypothetical protein